MILHKLNLTLRQKIIFLTCGMIFLSCLLIGTFISYRIYHATETIAVNGLASETRLVAQKFEESYHQMANDVRIIQHMPPIEGIIRSRNTGIDPHDGSTYSLWCTRLASIFTSMMQTRPYYTQMRYIGIEDNGRELVRVNRTAHSLETVTPEDLQQKSSEPYFQRGLLLKKMRCFFPKQPITGSIKKSLQTCCLHYVR